MSDELPQSPAEPSAQQSDTMPKEQYYRLAADFENYRKAMDQQLIEMSKFGIQRVVLKMVDVIDLMDHAMAHATEAVRQESEWFHGLEKIDEQFHETMKEYGVVRIDCVGKLFDPATMEAISQVPGGEPDTVQSELRAGYMLHDRVIRPARVILFTSN
ncbi:MAG: nucleotide exchange factor GrpE [Candidatus Pacebacteria bacterium]|nr:nucleotide exchange factor GrpE [Candidatus Paceibacterota bacterium]